jgi:hypothetical protein
MVLGTVMYKNQNRGGLAVRGDGAFLMGKSFYIQLYGSTVTTQHVGSKLEVVS